MKDLIKEVALEVADKQQVETIPMQLSPTPSDLITAYLLSEDDLVEFATAFLAELSKRAEAVAVADGSFNHNCELGSPLFTFPPIHDIEAIENRVAEACAKWVKANIRGRDGGSFIAEAIQSGAWRKYK